MEPKRMTDDSELKALVKLVGDAEALASSVSSGTTLSEFGELLKVAEEVPEVIKNGSAIVPEWQQLDDAAQADLVAFVQQNIKYAANVSVEMWTQKILIAAVYLSKVIQVFSPQAG